MIRLALAVAAVAGLLAPASAAPKDTKANPNPKSLEVPLEELSKARELVQKFSSEEYAEREAAGRELAQMGRLARVALLDGVNTDPDPEVRARCRALLPRANAEEIKARLDSFVADTQGKYEHDLPGWHKLRAVVRGEWTVFGWSFAAQPNAERVAREMFIEFMEASGGRKLLTVIDGPPAELGRVVGSRKQELYSRRFPRTPGVPSRNPTAAEVAVVVFAESQVHSRYVPKTNALLSVINTSGFATLARGADPKSLAARAILSAWFDTRTDPTELYSALSLANNVQNEAAARRLAGRLMAATGVQGFYKGQALTTLVRYKAVDQMPAVEKAFNDKAVLTTRITTINGQQVRQAVLLARIFTPFETLRVFQPVRIRQSIEVRDAALAAAIVMTGQNPAAYGFDGFPRNSGRTTFSYSYARINESERKAAFEKWKDWRKKNP